MDHYVPKRRIAVTLWTGDQQGVAGQLFLDLDAHGSHHPTLLDMLNLSTPFLPVVVGDEGRIHLYRRDRLTRVTPSRQSIPSDLYARGFHEWRDERADLTLVDGTRMTGKVWIPLERSTERLSDFLNRSNGRFFVIVTASGTQFVNASAVTAVELDEGAGAPLASFEEEERRAA
jgi:hypothetical protein